MKATDKVTGQIEWPNRRELRARQLVSEIMHAIDGMLPDPDENNVRHDIYYKLFDLLSARGAYVLTDVDREAAGLPARGPNGWTAEELLALEQKSYEMLTRPLFVTMPATADEANKVSGLVGFTPIEVKK